MTKPFKLDSRYAAQFVDEGLHLFRYSVDGNEIKPAYPEQSVILGEEALVQFLLQEMQMVLPIFRSLVEEDSTFTTCKQTPVFRCNYCYMEHQNPYRIEHDPKCPILLARAFIDTADLLSGERRVDDEP